VESERGRGRSRGGSNDGSHHDKERERDKEKDGRDERDKERDKNKEREKEKEREKQEADAAAAYAQSFLQNPYYFMFASLAKPDDDAELHWLKVGFSFLFEDGVMAVWTMRRTPTWTMSCPFDPGSAIRSDADDIPLLLTSMSTPMLMMSSLVLYVYRTGARAARPAPSFHRCTTSRIRRDRMKVCLFSLIFFFFGMFDVVFFWFFY
jgi:hypothetical protein